MKNACRTGSEASLALSYLSTLTHKRHDIQKKKVIENKMRILFVWNISQSEKKWARYNQTCLATFMQSAR